MTHILITDLREIRYITGKIESVPLDPEKDTLSFDREEDRELAIKLIRAKYMKSTDSLYDVKPGIYQVPVEVEVVTVDDSGLPNTTKQVARIVQPKDESQEDDMYFNCPSCGDKIAYGLNEKTMDAFRKSKLFTEPKPESQEELIGVTNIIQRYEAGMSEYFRMHDYRNMYGLWEQFTNEVKNGIKIRR